MSSPSSPSSPVRTKKTARKSVVAVVSTPQVETQPISGKESTVKEGENVVSKEAATKGKQYKEGSSASVAEEVLMSLKSTVKEGENVKESTVNEGENVKESTVNEGENVVLKEAGTKGKQSKKCGSESVAKKAEKSSKSTVKKGEIVDSKDDAAKAEQSKKRRSQRVAKEAEKPSKSTVKKGENVVSKDAATKGKQSKKRGIEIVAKEAEKPSKKLKIEKPRKKVVKGKQKVKEAVIPTVRIRTSPNRLCNALNFLKDGQKQVLREMGFGSLIGMNIDQIPGSLGYFVVDNLDVDSLSLKVSDGSIDINRQVVHDILGIPMGDIDLLSLPLKEVKDDEVSFITTWKSQFGVSSIRPMHLDSIIRASDDTSLFFKCNFLMLFATTMISSDKGGACSSVCQKAIVERICEDTEIEKIDWCGFFIDQLKICKEIWPPPPNKDYYFCGPMTFLQLLYLDSTFCEKFPVVRQRPAIKYWNPTYILERVKVELEVNGSFGKLPCQPAFSEFIVEEGFIASTSAPKVVKNSSPKSNEEYRSKIEALFIEVDSTLKKGVSMFPDDVKLVELNDKFQQFFSGTKLFSDKDAYERPDEDDVVHDEDIDDGAHVDLPKDGYFTPVVSAAKQDENDFNSPLKSNLSIIPFPTVSPAPIADPVVECHKDLSSKEVKSHVEEVPESSKQYVVRKRLLKPSKYLDSPYKQRETDVSASLTKLEFSVSGSIFVMDKDASEIVFETISGIKINRSLFESLAPGLPVYANIIDIWSLILNEEQQIDGGSVTRLFLQTSTISSNMWDGTLSFEEAYKIFDENVRSLLGDKEELMSLNNIETVFFPIVAFEHFYLVVFNLGRVSFNIIDNSAACNDYEVKYKAVCSRVHLLFSRYLAIYGHAKAASIRRAKPSILKMKWRTQNNFVDCGVFLMCHMDTYLGQPLSRWNPGFVSEATTGKVTQMLQLNRLRAKYCTKILLYDNNIHKSKMLAYANDFEEKYDIPAGKKAIHEAVSCRLHVVQV